MTRFLAYASTVAVLAMVPSLASADADNWYATPEHQDDCGPECFTGPRAWIETMDGSHAFGLSCDGPMILGGPAMMQSDLPFSEAEMAIDGRSFGRFSVYQGLNDTYVSAIDPTASSPPRVREAISSGNALAFRMTDYPTLNFTLSGSRAAIQKMTDFCIESGF